MSVNKLRMRLRRKDGSEIEAFPETLAPFVTHTIPGGNAGDGTDVSVPLDEVLNQHAEQIEGKQPQIAATGATNLLTAPDTAGGQPGTLAASTLEPSRATVTQALAEAGASTTTYGWTPQRVAQAVRGAILTGLSTATSAVITATDTFLTALGEIAGAANGSFRACQQCSQRGLENCQHHYPRQLNRQFRD